MARRRFRSGSFAINVPESERDWVGPDLSRVQSGTRYRIVYSNPEQGYASVVGGLELRAALFLWGQALEDGWKVNLPPQPDVGCFPSPWCGCDKCQPEEEDQWRIGSIPQYPQGVSSIEQSASEYLAGLAFEPDAYTRVCHGAPPHRRGVNTKSG